MCHKAYTQSPWGLDLSPSTSDGWAGRASLKLHQHCPHLCDHLASYRAPGEDLLVAVMSAAAASASSAASASAVVDLDSQVLLNFQLLNYSSIKSAYGHHRYPSRRLHVQLPQNLINAHQNRNH